MITFEKQQCPAGHFCDDTSQFPISCPRGTERYPRQGTLLTDCSDCINSVCDTVGIGSGLNQIERDCYDGYSCATKAGCPSLCKFKRSKIF